MLNTESLHFLKLVLCSLFEGFSLHRHLFKENYNGWIMRLVLRHCPGVLRSSLARPMRSVRTRTCVRIQFTVSLSFVARSPKTANEYRGESTRAFCNRLARSGTACGPLQAAEAGLGVAFGSDLLLCSFTLRILSEKEKVLTNWSYRSFINEEAFGINRSTCSFGILRETHS